MKLSIIPLACLALMACEKQSKQKDNLEVAAGRAIAVAMVELQNPSEFTREQQASYFSYYDLGLSDKQAEAGLFVIADGKALDSQQVDWDFDGAPDGILFLTDLEPGALKSYEIYSGETSLAISQTKLTQAEISVKTGGEWVKHSKQPDSEFQEYVGGSFQNVQSVTPPSQYTDHSNWIRYEGPGIESDKVGYRIYLDWRNGFDIFGKLIPEPVLQQVGLDGYESYHNRENWGMDILKVGDSLGAGGFGLWHNDQLTLIQKTASLNAEILENGNLRSSFKIKYEDWQSELGKQDFTANFAMLGGSRLAKVELNFTQAVDNIAIGVVKHPDTTFIQGELDITGKAYTYIASWGKQSLSGENLGMAVFFLKEDLDKVTQNESNYIAVLNLKGKPNSTNQEAHELDYYFAAVWAVESGINDLDAFEHYLEQEAEKLTLPPRQRLKTQSSILSSQIQIDPEQALSWSQRLADSELRRKTLDYRYDGWDVNRQRKPKFEYDIVGLNPLAYDDLGQKLDNPRYKAVLEQVTGSFIQKDGNIHQYKLENYNIDAVAPGRAVLRLYQLTGYEKYKKAADILRNQLASQPKTSEGAFWHKQKYSNQLWLDGVYMGMPFLAEYSALFEKGHSFEEVINEFKLTRKYLRDPKTGLYYHAWDESKQQSWADPKTGLSSHFWGRGVGWLALALVDVLDYIPPENPQQRQVLLDMVSELANTLIEYQDPATHTWWQVMDKPMATGNYRESSASAMFTYFFAKAVNQGYLPSSYKDVATQAYQGLLTEFMLVHADGSVSMTNQCYVAGLGFGRDGSYQYYMSEPVVKNDIKGNFAFILAGIQIAKLLER
ncbi:glycoside hydrolase family 88 protein [Paraglaciecola sp. 25GB23A]|uniref:glycoside hydrolase family 88 protein n=1 Tax=Paraglaciecola sp. 25GB23A TaxID=3156068 RepID=UPI0032AF4A6D